MPWYAVSHQSDGYSGLRGGATLVTAYRGTAIAHSTIAVPRYAVDYYTDVTVILTTINLDDSLLILMVQKGAPMTQCLFLLRHRRRRLIQFFVPDFKLLSTNYYSCGERIFKF